MSRFAVRRLVVALAMILVALAAAAPSGAAPSKPPRNSTPPADPGTLILFDNSGPWGHLGELYAIQVANLVGHFGASTAKPTSSYTAGMVENHNALIYIGSTYDEPLPNALVNDTKTTAKPVMWLGNNIWQLGSTTELATRFGFHHTAYDPAVVTQVNYRGQSLLRNSLNGGGIMNVQITDATRATPVADAVRPDGTVFPFATRSGNFRYFGEIPFSYATEGDRVIVIQDQLFDLLAPETQERHRALVRLEDLSPTSDPAHLRAAADYLHSRGVPFGFGVSPLYVDAAGVYNGGIAENVKLRNSPEVISAINYMISKGGTMVEHGYSHQYGTEQVANPFNGVSGDDYEFYRVTENADHSLTYVGPVAEDSERWVQNRIDAAAQEFRASKLPTPTIFEFPHYAGSDISYRTVAKNFSTRWERGLFFGGTLEGKPANYQNIVGQQFPYVVKDIYGTKVLPENLGDISPEPWYNYPAKLPAELLGNAQRNLAVRDGFASFFFHPYLDHRYLHEMVEGIQAMGYTFVSPTSL